VLLTTPHITLPAHHRGREPPCCHTIGHIQCPVSLQLQLCVYLAPFVRYYHLFHNIYGSHVTLNTSVWGSLGGVRLPKNYF